MATWDRSTPWRQGSVLTADAAATLGLHQEPVNSAVVVISHDCDLAQDPSQEPIVEAIIGRFVHKGDGNYVHAKNLRCLHLPYTAGSSSCIVELQPRNRVILHKSTASGPSLADSAPHPDFRLTKREHRTLQRWLAARYDRSAFPDEFDRRLKVETGVSEPLSKAFKEAGEHIPAVFFDVDEGEDQTRNGVDDPYQLVITLLYSTDVDPDRAQRAAAEVKQRIQGIFDSRCRVKDGQGVVSWRWIELQEIEVLSDEALTYAQSTLLTRWQADHISLRADPPQPIART